MSVMIREMRDEPEPVLNGVEVREERGWLGAEELVERLASNLSDVYSTSNRCSAVRIYCGYQRTTIAHG